MGAFLTISNESITGITNGLETFGQNLLDNFVAILPALAGIAAILMILAIIKRKVKA